MIHKYVYCHTFALLDYKYIYRLQIFLAAFYFPYSTKITWYGSRDFYEMWLNLIQYHSFEQYKIELEIAKSL